MRYLLLILIVFFSCKTNNVPKQEIVSLKEYVQEAIKKDIIGKDALLMLTQNSIKIYSKTNIDHYIFKKLNKKDLFVIPKDSELVDEIFNKSAKENGVIVFKAAIDYSPNENKLRVVLNGKEVSKIVADTLKLDKTENYVCIKNNNNQESVMFINTLNNNNK